MEPVLLKYVSSINPDIDFNKSLIKLDDDMIKFIDETVSPTGNGGNILGINKNVKFDENNLIFKVLK